MTSNPATLTVRNEAGAPVVSTDPTDVAVSLGSTAQFTAAATANPPATVQWEVSRGGVWTLMPGATSTTLSIDDVTLDDEARYRAVFTNTQGSVTTAEAVLTITRETPTITAQPVAMTVPVGGTARFSAAASGDPNPGIQWESSLDGMSWAPIAGATSSTLELVNVTAAQSTTRFRAVFTNTFGEATTEPALLTVTSQEVFQEYCAEAYGPRPVDVGHEFCIVGPDKLVVGEDIIIEGVGGFLATDDTTGSVVNFFIDAEFSGDPNTLYTKGTVTHPVNRPGVLGGRC